MSNKHWLYRVLSDETAEGCFQKLEQGILRLRLSHPIAWNINISVHHAYARLLMTGSTGRSNQPLPWGKPELEGITDPTEGVWGPHTITEPIPKSDTESVQSLGIDTSLFLDPKIRAICFSYFYGSREGLMREIQKSVTAYGKGPSVHKNEHWIYGEVENFLQAFIDGSAPKPSYFRAAPVTYLEHTWDPTAVSASYPWEANHLPKQFFNLLHSIYQNTKITCPDAQRRATQAIDLARSILYKLLHPYGREKEIRIFAYSDAFNDAANLHTPEDFFNGGSIFCTDCFADTIEISSNGITTSKH